MEKPHRCSLPLLKQLPAGPVDQQGEDLRIQLTDLFSASNGPPAFVGAALISRSAKKKCPFAVRHGQSDIYDLTIWAE